MVSLNRRNNYGKKNLFQCSFGHLSLKQTHPDSTWHEPVHKAGLFKEMFSQFSVEVPDWPRKWPCCWMGANACCQVLKSFWSFIEEWRLFLQQINVLECLSHTGETLCSMSAYFWLAVNILFSFSLDKTYLTVTCINTSAHSGIHKHRETEFEIAFWASCWCSHPLGSHKWK